MYSKEHRVAAFGLARNIAIGLPAHERQSARPAIAQFARTVRSILATPASVAFGNHLS